MEQEKVNQLLMMMGSKIPSESIPMVRDRLLKSDMSESDFLIGKLLTFGECYIWALVDIFLIMGATKEKNLELLLTHIH